MIKLTIKVDVPKTNTAEKKVLYDLITDTIDVSVNGEGGIIVNLGDTVNELYKLMKGLKKSE